MDSFFKGEINNKDYNLRVPERNYYTMMPYKATFYNHHTRTKHNL